MNKITAAWWMARILIVALGVALPSCGLFKKGSAEEGPVEEAEEAEEAPAQLIGEVASVHGSEAQGFVLIRRFGGGALPQGFVFHSRGKTGRTASLRPTGERLGRFYAADVTGGTPEAGDLVLARRLPEAAEAPSIPLLQPTTPGLQDP